MKILLRIIAATILLAGGCVPAMAQHLMPMSGYGYEMNVLSTQNGFFVPNRDTSFDGTYKRAGALVFRTLGGDRTLYAFDGIKWINVTAALAKGLDSIKVSNDTLFAFLSNSDTLYATMPLSSVTSPDNSVHIEGDAKVWGDPLQLTVDIPSGGITKDSASYSLKGDTGISVSGGEGTQFINDIKIKARYDTAIWNAGAIANIPILLGVLRDSQALVYDGGVFTNKDVQYGAKSPFDGDRPITRDFSEATGVNLGTTDVGSTLEELLYPSQNPLSGLTVTYNGTTATSITVEKTSASTIDVTLNWTAGRRDYTDDIDSIVVNGVNEAFTQPDSGTSISGTQAASVPSNATKSISNRVVTTDGKVSTSFVSINFKTKWYYGFVDPSITTPSDADIIGLAGQALTSTRVQNNGNGSDIVVPNSTNRRFVIVQDAALDPSGINQIFVGGLNSTGAFTKTTRSFTNASGYSYSVNIYVLDNTTSGQFNFQIQ